MSELPPAPDDGMRAKNTPTPLRAHLPQVLHVRNMTQTALASDLLPTITEEKSSPERANAYKTNRAEVSASAIS
jgi:hypothetical protein